MTEFSEKPEFSRPIATADLPRLAGTLQERATASERDALAQRFGIPGIRELAFEVELQPWRGKGWRVKGYARGIAERECVVTRDILLEEVSAPIHAGFLPANLLPRGGLDGTELEIAIDPEIDESPEILGEKIDLGELTAEVFSLALKPFPRKEGLTYVRVTGGPPGSEALTDETSKPLAGLAALKARFER